MKKLIIKNTTVHSLAVAVILFCIFAPDANAQMNETAWSFKSQNRASIAALIRSVEEENDTSATTATTAGSTVTQLVCGGDSANASAAGNSTCIILNNSDGFIDLYQDNIGDIGADSDMAEGSETVEDTIDVAEETPDVEDVQAILDGSDSS